MIPLSVLVHNVGTTLDIKDRVKYTEGPLTFFGCHLGPSTLKLHFWVHELLKWFTAGLCHLFNLKSNVNLQNTPYLYLLTRSPSAHLIKRLRQHEALQRRCGPGTEAYRAAAARLRPWRRDGTNDGVCRYLVLVPYRGLGNRILAAASAFLYVVLTNRVLLLDGNTSMGRNLLRAVPGDLVAAAAALPDQ